MSYYDDYKTRLNAGGSTIKNLLENSTKDAINASFKNSPNYFQVKLNGSANFTDVRIISSSLTQDETIKKLIVVNATTINPGDYLLWGNDYWLVVTHPDESNSIYNSTLLRKCNLLPFRFKINNITKTIYGFYEKNTAFTYNSPTNNQIINLPDDTILITIPNNSDTNLIDIDDVFYIYDTNWYECYQVTMLDRSKIDGSKGLIIFRGKLIQTDQNPQEFYDQIPSGDVIGSVVITPSSISLTLNGGVKQLSAKVYDPSGVEMPAETVTWSSTNVAIATVDQTGKATPVALGTCEILATSNTDDEIIGKCMVEVVSAGSWWN